MRKRTPRYAAVMIAARPIVLLPVLLVVLFVVVPGALGCGPEPLPFAPAGPDAAPDPSSFGPYPVGVTQLVFVDTARPGPGGQGSRTLVTEVWYPAAESARDAAGVSYSLYDALRVEVRSGLTPEALGTLTTRAVQDAEVRQDERFPVVLFSHGKGGIRLQSTFYTVLLASHGYVVVAPDHEGDTISDLLVEGDVNVTSTAEQYVERPIDVTFLLNELGRLHERTDTPRAVALAGLMDMGTIGITGHSFGALTSMIAVGQDVRLQAAVAQAPAGLTLVEAPLGYPLEEIGKPIMIQSASQDQILPEDINAQSLWDHMVPPRAWLSMHRAGHFTYSDLCVLDVVAIDAALAIDASNVLDDGCGPENIATELAFPLINSAAVGFFNVHLRNSDASTAFLTQETQDALAAGESTLSID